MAKSYQVLIGFNVKQEDGTEIRCEPDGRQLSVTSEKMKDKGGNEYLRQVETPLAKPVAIEKLLTATQIKELCEMVPPALAIVESKLAEKK